MLAQVFEVFGTEDMKDVVVIIAINYVNREC